MIFFAAAAPIGLLIGLLAWSVAGGATAGLDRLDPATDHLMALRAPVAVARRETHRGSSVLAAPLFALTVGPGAVREVAIRVDGLSVSRRRNAALVSIDGAAAQWMSVGESRDGVTLQAVSSTKAVFDTTLGNKELALGEQSAASAPPVAANAVEVSATNLDHIPPGFRSPPPPASAKEQPQ